MGERDALLVLLLVLAWPMDGLSDQWSALESLLYRTEVFGLCEGDYPKSCDCCFVVRT